MTPFSTGKFVITLEKPRKAEYYSNFDSVDFDLEGGSGTGMIAFAQRLRTLMNGGGKKFYLTAAPQCVFPDAYVGSIINAVPFDAVYVQVSGYFISLAPEI